MKNVLIVGIAFLVLGTTSSGQESRPSIGLGVGLDPVKLVTVGSQTFSLALTPVVFSLPIIVNDNIRIEPDLGFFSYSSESGTSTRSGSFYRLGAGVQFQVARYENTWLYLGPKFGLFLISSKSGSGSSSTETSETDFFLSANLGGEQALSQYFRVFGEVQVYYLSFGEPKTTYSPPPPFPVTPSDRSQRALFTNVVLGARIFF